MLSLSNATAEGETPSAIRLRVLSPGTGIQSIVPAVMAAQVEIGPVADCAIFADTDWESRAACKHLDWLR